MIMMRLVQCQMQRNSFCRVLGNRCMSSVSFEAFGEPSSVLKVGDTVAADQPSSGQVKVSLKANPVTCEDIRSLRGLSTSRTLTGVAGAYGVGTVEAVGPGVVGLTPSSHVFVASNNGTWNSEGLFSSREVFPIDSDSPPLDFSHAACLAEAATAWALLHNFASLNSGDVVVRSAETSVVNSAIDQIAKAKGIVVVSASYSDLVDSKFKEKLASKGSVKLALTSETGKSARALHALTGSKGVLVTYNGTIPPMNDNLHGIQVPSLALIFEDKEVCGFDFLAWASNRPTEASKAITESMKLMHSGELNLSPSVFKVAKAKEAIACANSGKSAVIEL